MFMLYISYIYIYKRTGPRLPLAIQCFPRAKALHGPIWYECDDGYSLSVHP